jgi:hypothetical protein
MVQEVTLGRVWTSRVNQIVLKGGLKMIGKFAAIAAVGAMIAGPALAADASIAQLGAVKGSVMVSQNGKMVSVSAASLKAGDRVVTQANGTATVKFADGCVVNLKAASMVTVGAKSPCAAGAGLVSASQAQPAALSAESIFGTGWTTVDYALLGVAAIGVGVAISDSGANDHNHSTSP